MDAEVGREPQYDVFADEFLGHAQGGFYNAYYDRPACLALLGDVTGKRVLDAACGPGLYAAELIGRGAQVVGFDHSPRMVQLCRARVLHPTGDWLRHGGSYFDVRTHSGDVEQGLDGAVLAGAAGKDLRGDLRRRVPDRAADRTAPRARGRRYRSRGI